jgi:hypothetical protein
MHVVSKTGRAFDLPNAEEEAEICRGIADDESDGELGAADLARLRAPGRPKAPLTRLNSPGATTGRLST